MRYKSIVKDHTKNIEYVEIKHKPDLPIKGRASVYLYNARTGKLELEAHTPNIIYPEVYAWLKSYQWDKFCTGAYNKSISYGGYWEMDNIYLTTSDRPETERVNIWNYDARDVSGANPGKMIGWANKSTYQGTDPQRGTPNTAESYANNSRIHWVFDWPTNAGNGTFQSIIWGNQLVPYIGNISIISTGISTGDNRSGFGLTYDGSYLYALSWGGMLYKLTTDGILLGSAISTGISTDYHSGFGLTYDGSYLYALSWDGKLYKLTTDGILSGSAISTGISTGSYSGFGLAYANGYLYAISRDGQLYTINDASDHFFARTLLASPVTKTDQQTMKIQYDFIYGE